DKPKKDESKSKPATAPVFTVVHAPDLIYTEETRVALYQGGVSLTRPGLTVNAKEIRAFLKDADQDSSLEKPFSQGPETIVSTQTGRTRTGTSDHAEYYAGEEKVILERGEPLLMDDVRGKTGGQQLPWWANNDRLLVNGVETAPAKSTIVKKRKK